MKPEKLLKELKSQGVVVEHGKKHYILRFNGRKTTMPRHPAKEIPDKYFKIILKQLGIK